MCVRPAHSIPVVRTLVCNSRYINLVVVTVVVVVVVYRPVFHEIIKFDTFN